MTEQQRIGLFVGLSLGVFAVATVQPQPAQPPPLVDFADDLRGRHPEIVRHPDFVSWAKPNQIGPWHESATSPDGLRTVVVENTQGTQLFGALVSVGRDATVRRAATIDLADRQQTRQQARDVAGRRWAVPRQVRQLRPVIEFGDIGRPPEFRWEIEVINGPEFEIYRLPRDNKIGDKPDSTRKVPQSVRFGAGGVAAAAGSGTVSGNVDPADNELHHVAAFKQQAEDAAKGATTLQEKAQRVFDAVQRDFKYNGGIPYIDKFTWSDLLTRDTNQREGVCDELAVVAMTYLRALGIPARYKLISWTIDARERAHAIVEYQDGTVWKHLDTTRLFGFNNPGVYLSEGKTDIKVMLADQPWDARSIANAYGVTDANGDGMLHPYLDFIVAPPYPGQTEQGYSK